MRSSRLTKMLVGLFLLACCGHAAHANGVSSSIGNGEAKTGTLTGEGVDTYTFSAAAGGAIVAVVSETGAHDENFIIGIERTTPAGRVRGTWKTHFAEIEDRDAAEGTWTFKVSRAERGNSGSGGYRFNVVQVPGAGATAMSDGQNHDGSVGRGEIKAYTFSGTAGRTRTLTLSRTGGTGYPPKLSVYAPDGALITGKSCGETCEKTVRTANGTYTVLLTRYDEGGDASAYRLSVNSAQ